MSFEFPHRRYNPLSREWVLVSPQRARRPWLGQVEKIPAQDLPAYDPNCYLCPGNRRAGAQVNPDYSSTFVFDNDFPALLTPEKAGSDTITQPRNGLLRVEPEYGMCRVVCFSPRHDLTLPQLSQEQVEEVVRTWADQTGELGSRDFISYVQVFENKGEMMGCSNPHPHSQIWTTSNIPNEPAKEIASLGDYWESNQRCLLCDYLAAEQQAGERIVAANQHFTALVPYWAVWPFEILLLAHRHTGSLTDLEPGEVSALAGLVRQITARYDNLFEISFQYSMGFHQAPTIPDPSPTCHLHAHYYPPLLRSATVRKFMVGYEMMAMPQRDLTPETAAERLRGVSAVHFRLR